jgi:hypothetical protein
MTTELMPESSFWWLLGTFLMAWFGSMGYREHKRRERFTQAADVFNSAFLTAITRLETKPWNYRNILNDEFRNHERAAIAFRQHLGLRVDAFDEAWKKYEAYAKKVTDVPLIAFITTEVTDINRGNDPAHIAEVANMRKKECLAHINALLKFAKQK